MDGTKNWFSLNLTFIDWHHLRGFIIICFNQDNIEETIILNQWLPNLFSKSWKIFHKLQRYNIYSTYPQTCLKLYIILDSLYFLWIFFPGNSDTNLIGLDLRRVIGDGLVMAFFIWWCKNQSYVHSDLSYTEGEWGIKNMYLRFTVLEAHAFDIFNLMWS